jgi:hypothetical protein
MTADPFALELTRAARAELFESARHAARHGTAPDAWLVHHAAQWALDAVTQREVDAVIAYVWRSAPPDAHEHESPAEEPRGTAGVDEEPAAGARPPQMHET